MHVGRLVMVQGSSGFGKDLPPFVIAAERNCCFRLKHRRNAPRRTQRERSKRNQGGIQTCLPERTKHFAGPRQSGDDDLWRTSTRIPGLRCQCKEAWHLPVETRHAPRRVGLTPQAEFPRFQTQPPCTGGMIAISSPGFSL